MSGIWTISLRTQAWNITITRQSSFVWNHTTLLYNTQQPYMWQALSLLANFVEETKTHFSLKPIAWEKVFAVILQKTNTRYTYMTENLKYH